MTAGDTLCDLLTTLCAGVYRNYTITVLACSRRRCIRFINVQHTRNEPKCHRLSLLDLHHETKSIPLSKELLHEAVQSL